MSLLRAAAAVALLGAATGGCATRDETFPRIVLVTLDTTRADRLGCYGYERASTPNLDDLARGAVLFEHAVSSVPTTLPSHSTIFTGTLPQDHGVRYNLVYRLAPEARTLAEMLHEAGYATAGFPASFIVARRYGLAQGFDTYEEPSLPEEKRSDRAWYAGLPAGEIAERALAWLDGRPDDERQFLWVHFYDPHHPYDPPFPYSSTFRARPYDGELAYADAQLGRLLERLRADPQWEHTVVMVVGDHGEGLYDHGERWHGNLVYETTQHVPLIVRVPGVAPRRVAEPVGLADVMPTLLDLAGVAPPAKLRGRSLRPALAGGELQRRDLYFESLAGSLNYGWAELHGVRYGSWKLIDADPPELYDLARDPGETNDLASREPRRLEDLRAALAELERPLFSAPTASEAHDPVPDAETERFLASLGYVGAGSGGSATGAPGPARLIDLEPELLAAQEALALGHWDQVEDVARYVLSRDPTNKWCLDNLARALLAEERPGEAQEVAAEFVRLYPDTEAPYVRLAETYRAQERFDRAREVLRRGRESATPEGSARLTYLELVNAFDLGGDDPCDAEVPAAVERFPDSALLRVLRARCEARAGDAEAALATLREAVDLGLRGLERLEKSEEFRDVAALPGFRDLTGNGKEGSAAGEAAPSGEAPPGG